MPTLISQRSAGCFSSKCARPYACRKISEMLMNLDEPVRNNGEQVIITTSNKPVGETFQFAEELINIFPTASKPTAP